MSIRSACLEYTCANQLLRRVPLEASYSDGSAVTYVGDDSAEAVGASVIEGVSYYDLAYASSSESKAFTLPLGATPLVCELVVNLAGKSSLGQAGTDRCSNVTHRERSFVLANGTVGQSDGKHF